MSGPAGTSKISPATFQNTARSAAGFPLQPTMRPASLMSSALLHEVPDSRPKFSVPSSAVQRNARAAYDAESVPQTTSKLLMAAGNAMPSPPGSDSIGVSPPAGVHR